MKLPFFNGKDSKKNLYLGLFLKEREGLILILNKKDSKFELWEKKKFHYTNGWDNLTEDIDEAIFELEKKLNVEVNKTIFFLYSHFVNEKTEEIKKIYLNKIKEVVTNLGLSPLGYIECIEGVSSFLSQKEQTPLTAIVLEIDNSQLSVFIYKGGRLTFRKTIPRSDNIIDDLSFSFAELKGKFLCPSRIIIYNSKDLDELSTKILTHRWSEEYFIQLPKVEIMKEEELIKALIEVFNQQITNISPNFSDEEKMNEENKEQVLGFLIGKDVAKERPKETIAFKKTFLLKDKILNKLKSFYFPKIFLKIDFSQKLLIFIVLFLGILGLMINEIFFHTASLTLFVPSLKMEKSLTISMPYQVATISAEFMETKNTTGEREVGEKARGEVIVYNTNLNKEKIIEKGKEIETENLKFIFDEKIKIATATSATNPGRTKANVTALKIGDEYNLPKGKRFNIDDTTYAEVVADFTGGSKRKIQTISQKDIEDLKSAIIEKAKNDKNFYQRDVEGGIIVPQLSTLTLKEINPSGEVGEESSTVTLKAKVYRTNYILSKNELEKKIFSIINPQIPVGYNLNKDSISFQIKSATVEGKLASVNFQLQAKMIKKIDKSRVIKKVAGLNKKSLEDVLRKEFQVNDYDFNITSPLPVIKDFFPLRLKNINLTISSL